MFQKLKQFRELRHTAKQLQRELAENRVTVERNGITVELDGNLDVHRVTLPPGVDHDELTRRLPEALNHAIDKAQRIAADKIRQRGGLEGLGLGGKSQG